MTTSPAAGATALLALLDRRARDGEFEGFLNALANDLGHSPSWVSRNLRTLVAAGRIEIVSRGHGRHPSRVRVVSAQPLTDESAGPARSALADRLLTHLHTLSDDGVVERPLVEVARQLRVGAPSVSRALGQLVDEGLARVEVVGTRSRPTRIELVQGTNGHGDREHLAEELAAARAEIAMLRAELRATRARPARHGDRRGRP